jgi:phage/plasmid-like protein (TIGR03299 family)
MVAAVETMAYAGQVPWHGLGVEVPADLTPDQMLTKAGLDWTVSKKPLTYSANGSQVKAGKKMALIRDTDGQFLDVVSEAWNPLQNSEAFDFFNDFVGAGDMEMHTAGSLNDGKMIWALAKIKGAVFEAVKGDVVESYLLFANPHKFGACITVQGTDVRVVCNNTLNYALGMDSDRLIRVNHRQEFNADQVKETLGVAKEKLETYKEAAQFLASKRYTADSMVEYFNTVFPSMSYNNNADEKTSRQAKACIEAIDTQPGAEFGRGSFWQAFNAVTYLTDHELGRSNDTRLTSAWFGANRKKKQSALTTAVEFAEVA